MKNYLEKVNQFLMAEPDPAFARRAKIIFENLELSSGQKILDAGCGRGFYLKVLSSLPLNLDIYGLDLNPEYLKLAAEILKEERVRLLKRDITSLPFKDNFFDRVIASEILEHVRDDQKAIKEIFRVLKPAGVAVITVPHQDYPFFWDPLNFLLERFFKTHVNKNIWWLAGIWADHERLYGKRELKEKLAKEGLVVKKEFFSTTHCFPFSHFLLYGLGKNLLERGLLKNFNRFQNNKPSFLNKIILWPVRKVDERNERQKEKSAEVFVNLIIKVQKQQK
jgi:ubiquinone/menaquinone biosynthesis C-methylase UbiE